MSMQAHLGLVEVELETAKRFEQQLRDQFRQVHGASGVEALGAFFTRMMQKIESDSVGPDEHPQYGYAAEPEQPRAVANGW